MVTIRLSRGGANKLAFYRVVVTNSRSPRDGNFIEKLGTWDPCVGEGKITLDLDRYNHWVKLGAKPSELVAKLVKKAKTPAPQAPAKS